MYVPFSCLDIRMHALCMLVYRVQGDPGDIRLKAKHLPLNVLSTIRDNQRITEIVVTMTQVN